MREAAALVLRHLVAARRSSGAWWFAVVGLLLLLLLALLLGPGRATRSTFTLGGLALAGVLGFGVAAWTGSGLPADRAEGRETWLATLAPSGALRRAAVAVAGGLLALATTVTVAVLVGLLGPLVAVDATVRVTVEPAVPPDVRLTNPVEDGAPLRILLPPPPQGVDSTGRTLEVVLRPRYHRPDAVGHPLRVAWRAGGSSGETVLAYDGPLTLDLAPDATEAWIANRSHDLDLVVTALRVHGRETSYLASLLVAGLLLGVAAAAVAPAAAFVSRWTSAATAVATGLVLVMAGGVRAGLDALALPGGPWFQGLGLAIVEAAARLAPDLGALAPLGEPAAGRALGVVDLAGALPFLAYGAACLVLLLVPRPHPPGRELTT